MLTALTGAPPVTRLVPEPGHVDPPDGALRWAAGCGIGDGGGGVGVCGGGGAGHAPPATAGAWLVRAAGLLRATHHTKGRAVGGAG